MDVKELVVTATTELFNQHDPTALDRWFSPDYRQHSALAPDGLDGLRELAENMPADLRYEPARVLGEDDLVVLHGTYHGFGPEPLVAFDVFRVVDGQIVEHWDGMQPVVPDTVSGRSQTDGPAAVDPDASSAASRDVVAAFADEVLVGADYSRLDHFLLPDYHQHNPAIGDGIAGFGAVAAAWAAQGKQLSYRRVHRVIADHDFVLTHSEGDLGAPSAFLDLFRVADGRIVEHWDVISPIPDVVRHDNGIF